MTRKMILTATLGMMVFTTGHAHAGMQSDDAARSEERRVLVNDDETREVREREIVVAHGESRGRIGITLGRVDEALAAHLGVEPDEVVMVASVLPGGGADKAGVQQYDIIVAANGQRPVTPRTLPAIVRDHKPGEQLTLEVIREGQSRTIEVTIELARERQSLRLRDLDVEQLEEQLRDIIGEEEYERFADEMERLWGNTEEHLAKLQEIGIGLPDRFREHLERGEQAASELRDHIERDVKALLDEVGPVEEELEKLLDEVEQQINRLLRENRLPLGLSRQMQIIEDEDGGKSIVIRPHPDGAGGRAPRGGMGGGAHWREREGRGLGGGGGLRREQPEAAKSDARLDDLEQRLERIEQMLEQLLDQ